jgi:hypothetical protein
VLVHLLGKLARQLYRLDMRTEGLSEGSFENRLDPSFDAS